MTAHDPATEPLHIVCVITQFPPYITTGVGRYIEAIHPKIADRHRLRVVTINPGGLPPIERCGSLTVVRTMGRLLGWVSARRRLNHTRRLDFVILTVNVLINNLRFFFQIRRLARRQRVDVIAVHDSTNFVAALLCHRFVDAPLVFHLHSTEYTLAPRRVIADPLGVFRSIERTIGRVAARTVVPTPELRAALADDGWDASRIDVVPLGNTLEDVLADADADGLAARGEAARRRLGLPDDARVLLFVGRLVEQKGVVPLVTALRQVVAADPRVHLLLVGDGDTNGVRAAVRAGGLGRHVVLTGRFVETEEVVDCYALAEVCVFPSLFEPFGLVALEAMSVARPVVLGRGFSQLFAGDPDRPAVRYVDGDDPDDIARVVLEVLGDDDLRARLGARAQRLVRARFGWRRTADDTIDVYRRVVAHRTVANVENAVSGR